MDSTIALCSLYFYYRQWGMRPYDAWQAALNDIADIPLLQN